MATILLVDDEKSIRVTMSALLVGAGHAVLTAESVDEALRMLDGDAVDLVISDILLPGRKGTALLPLVRAQWPRVPVILMTGEPSFESAGAAIRGHAFDYLSKPVSKERLLDTVAQALQLKAGADEHARLAEENRCYQETLEQRVAERTARLQESETRYRELADLLPQAVFETDIGGRVLYANQHAFALFGVTQEEFARGVTALEFLAPEDRERGAQNLARKLAGDAAVDIEYNALRRDGTTFSALIYTTLIRSRDAVTGLRGIVVDVSEQKRAENALRESEERYRQLVELAPDGVMLHQDGKFVYINPAGLELLGAEKPEELLGRPVIERVHPDFRAAVRQRIAGVGERQEFAQRLEEKLLRLDGTVFDAEVTANPILYHGRPAEQVIARDIGQRKRDEEELRRASEEWAQTFDAVPDLIAILNREHRIVRVNRALAARLAKNATDLFGKRCYEAIHGTSEPPDFCPHAALLKDGREHAAEIAVERLGGAFVVSASPLRDVRGEVWGCVHVARDISERKRIELTLAESETRYRALFEQAADAMLLSDARTGKLMDFNRKAYSQYGYTRDEFSRLSLPDLEALETPEQVQRHIARVIQQDGDFFETRHRTKDGRVLDIEVSAKVVSVGGQKLIQAACRDITREKRARQALLESEARLRALYENSMVGILLTAPDGTVLSANPAACRMLGRSEAEICRAGHMGIVDPRDERLSALLAERERAGSARGVLTLRRGDGTAFQADVASVLFETAEGPRSSMVIRDITEQECAEEALRASERKYRTLIAEMSIGCALRQLVCDAAGRPIDYVTLEVNRAFETMLNVKRAEVIGRKASEFLPASELKEWLAIFGPVVLTGKTRHYEQYSPLNRKYFEGAVFCPEPGKFAVTFADVTDRKRAEEKLRDTQRIEAVGTLCAGISHEYNNILMAIAGYAHHLRAGTRKGTEARTQAERIAALAERATVVSRGLLNFSRRSPMQVKPLDFDAVVRNSLRTMRDLIGEDIEIEMRLRSKACVPADEKQIEQVVVNLILNARDAMPKGGRLTVETSRESLSEGKVHTLGLEGGRKYAMLKIRDTGFGMNKDICRKAFEPFFTTKTPEAGTGLGLSAAQGIVHSHSGAIELDSEAGKGTVATVYLPCVEGDKSRSRLRARKA